MSKEVQPRTPFVRKRLGERLRDLRDQVPMTSAAIAERLGIKQGTVSKIETGRQAIRPAYVEVMCQAYGVSEKETRELVQWAKETGIANPLEQYSDVANADTLDYAQVEGTCEELWAHGTGQPFGPFQSPDFIRAIRKAAQPDSTQEDLDRYVELRQVRFENLKDKPVHVVIDEAMLHRLVGGSATMKGLCRHLQGITEMPLKKIQIVPLTAGAYAAQVAGFRIALRIPPEPKVDLIHIEHEMVALFLNSDDHLSRYKAMFVQLVDPEQGVALSQEDSWNLLDRLAKNL